MDVVYIYIILSGLSLFTFSPLFIKSLTWAGIGLILLLGFYEIFRAEEKTPKELNSPQEKLGITNLGGFFSLALILYLTNPVLVVTMTAIATFLKGLELFRLGQFNIALLSLSLGIGAFIWFILLSYIVKKFEQRLRQKYLKKFNQLSGILMIFLGTILIVRQA